MKSPKEAALAVARASAFAARQAADQLARTSRTDEMLALQTETVAHASVSAAFTKFAEELGE